jgi:hypothetical protein
LTVIDFTPSNAGPFTFQPTFDGTAYTCIVLWNLAGQRYYVECYSLANDLIFNIPLIGSPLDYDISITAGYFTTKMVYRVSNNQIEVI